MKRQLRSLLRYASVALACLALTSAVVVVSTPLVHAADQSAQYQINVSPLPHATADQNRIQTVFQVIFGALGATSLLMITIGGFRYITSEGDPQAAARAKGTIVYALIGLVVAISAVAIVTFATGGL